MLICHTILPVCWDNATNLPWAGVLAPGTVDRSGRNTRPLPIAGDAAASVPTFRCQRTWPLSLSIASATPESLSTNSVLPRITGGNSSSAEP